MEPQIYLSQDILLKITTHELAISEGKNSLFPIYVGDLIIWDEQSKISTNVFEGWLDLYFEYVILSNKTSYKITGLLTKNYI